MGRKDNKRQQQEPKSKGTRKEREKEMATTKHEQNQVKRKMDKMTKREKKRLQRQIDAELYDQDLAKFKQQLAPMMLKVVDIDGDGNCLFRAIADQLDGDESFHNLYRGQAVQAINENKEYYKMFMDDDEEDIDEYLRDMSKDGIWGGQLEINALATMLKFNVIVHQVDNPSYVQTYHEPIGSVPTVHLSFHMGEHYNSVRRGDDPCISGEAATSHYTIGHDLEKVKQTVSGNLNDSAKNGSKSRPDKISNDIIKYALEKIDPQHHDEEKMSTCLSIFFGDKKNKRKVKTKDVEDNLMEILSQYDAMALADSFDAMAIGKQQYSNLDKDELKHILTSLQKNKNLIIDPVFNKLSNVQVVQIPNRNKDCPCGSGLRYKKCCEGKDVVKRVQIIEEIEKYLQNDGKEKNESGKLLFV